MTSTCWQVTFYLSQQPSVKFEEFMNEFFEVFSQNYQSDGYDEFIGYSGTPLDEEQMIKVANSYGITLPKYKIEKLESENWLKDYVIEFPSFEIADFCIYGIHEKETPQTDKIPLQIYAATAFGSNHQTTQGCINAISELNKQGFIPDKILDIGTGSGILSLCSAKLWTKTSIIAGDIDDEAVIVTSGNAKNNNLNHQIKAIQSDGYNNPLIKQSVPYDLILSNILANPLISFAENLQQNLKQNGYCILSGFVDNQVDDVISAHEKLGLKLIKLYSIDNWRTALMQKA